MYEEPDGTFPNHHPDPSEVETLNDIKKELNSGEYDLGFAYEAMARSSALAKNKDDFKKYYKLAQEAGEKIAKKDDKDYFFEDLEGGKWFGMK